MCHRDHLTCLLHLNVNWRHEGMTEYFYYQLNTEISPSQSRLFPFNGSLEDGQLKQVEADFQNCLLLLPFRPLGNHGSKGFRESWIQNGPDVLNVLMHDKINL